MFSTSYHMSEAGLCIGLTTGFQQILSRTANAPNQTWTRDWESEMSDTFVINYEQFQIVT